MSDFDKTRLYADIADRDDTIEQLQQRVEELERVNKELESRLEDSIIEGECLRDEISGMMD